MNDYGCCCLCGIARYRHDMVSMKYAVKITDPETWKYLIPRAVFYKINHLRDQMACVEHFEKCCVLKFGTMSATTPPLKMSEEEKSFIGAYLHDHDYSSTYADEKCSDGCGTTKLSHIFCSLCSEKIEVQYISKHAIEHTGMTRVDELTGCDEHQERTQERKRTKCRKCWDEQDLQFEKVKEQAAICFPFVDLKNVEYPKAYIHKYFRVETIGRITEKYMEARPHLRVPKPWKMVYEWKKKTGLMEMSMQVSSRSADRVFKETIQDLFKNNEFTHDKLGTESETGSEAIKAWKRRYQTTETVVPAKVVKTENATDVKMEEPKNIAADLDAPEKYAEGLVEEFTWLDGPRAVRKMILRHFYHIVHPSYKNISDLMVGTECSFATVYHNFARLRQFYSLECKPDCACTRIQMFLPEKLESEPVKKADMNLGQIVIEMNKAFAENPFPRTEKYAELSKRFDLDLLDVVKYYGKQRHEQITTGGGYRSLVTLSKDLMNELCRLASEKEPVDTMQRILLATQYGVPYVSVSYWLDSFSVSFADLPKT